MSDLNQEGEDHVALLNAFFTENQERMENALQVLANGTLREFAREAMGRWTEIFERPDLNEKSFKALKKMEKESVAKQDHEKDCAICLDKLTQATEIPEDYKINPELNTDTDTLKSNVVIMPCKHRYHYFCLAIWLEKVSTCPTCRHQVKSDSAIEEEERKQNLEELHNSMFS